MAKEVQFIFGKITIPADMRLLAVVVLTGALGGQIHALRSFAAYVGNRKLITSWHIQYLLIPFEGASLALVFYLVICAGFLSSDSTTKNMNVYGFAGLAGLVGLFSDIAVKKLKEIAEKLLGSLGKQKDPINNKDSNSDN